jgi:hypothetical protein
MLSKRIPCIRRARARNSQRVCGKPEHSFVDRVFAVTSDGVMLSFISSLLAGDGNVQGQ